MYMLYICSYNIIIDYRSRDAAGVMHNYVWIAQQGCLEFSRTQQAGSDGHVLMQMPQLHNWHCSFKLFLEMARGQIFKIAFGGAKRAVCFFPPNFQFEGNDDPTKHMCNLYESIFDTFDTRTLKGDARIWCIRMYFGISCCKPSSFAILAAAAGDSWRCCAFLAFIALPSKSSWDSACLKPRSFSSILWYSFPPAQTQCVRNFYRNNEKRHYTQLDLTRWSGMMRCNTILSDGMFRKNPVMLCYVYVALRQLRVPKHNPSNSNSV